MDPWYFSILVFWYSGHSYPGYQNTRIPESRCAQGGARKGGACRAVRAGRCAQGGAGRAARSRPVRAGRCAQGGATSVQNTRIPESVF